MGNKRRAVIDSIGEKPWRLKCLEIDPNNSKNYRCQCDCGKIVSVKIGNFRNGHTKSCGCLFSEVHKKIFTKHSMTGTRTYRSWLAMIQRCTNPKNNRYKQYAERGITVCERWRNSFSNFVEDMGQCPPGHTLHRFPNETANYEPGSVKWALPEEQQSDTTRTHRCLVDGEVMTIAQACRKLGTSPSAVGKSLKRNNGKSVVKGFNVVSLKSNQGSD